MEDHIYMLTYLTVSFYLLLDQLMTNFRSLLRGQPHSPNVNHCIFIIFCFKSLRWITKRLTDPPNDWDIDKVMNTKKVKNIWKKLLVVNGSSPDRAYLYYQIYVEGHALTFLLHCCQLIWDKTNSNHSNKNFHQHKF